jgi:hypothetical protein
MRVKISYTVDLEEVPEKVHTLVDQAVEAAISRLEETNHTFKAHLLEKGNLQSSIDTLNSLREFLFKADQQLSDCANLLSNLQQAYITINQDEASDE